jgi:hypothetical protein
MSLWSRLKLALEAVWLILWCGNLPDAEETAKGMTNRIAALEGKLAWTSEMLALEETLTKSLNDKIAELTDDRDKWCAAYYDEVHKASIVACEMRKREMADASEIIRLREDVQIANMERDALKAEACR